MSFKQLKDIGIIWSVNNKWIIDPALLPKTSNIVNKKIIIDVK